MVVASPCPGKTITSSSNKSNLFIDLLSSTSFPPYKSVLPTPLLNKVSPLNKSLSFKIYRNTTFRVTWSMDYFNFRVI